MAAPPIILTSCDLTKIDWYSSVFLKSLNWDNDTFGITLALTLYHRCSNTSPNKLTIKAFLIVDPPFNFI